MFPISVLLRRIAKISPTSSNEERRSRAADLLKRLLPEEDIPRSLAYLAPLFGVEGVPIPNDITPGELRDQTIMTIAKVMSNLAAKQPVVVLCEDLHWSDDTTATVVSRVCEHLELLKAMVVITMRPSTDAPPLNKASIVWVPLQPLDRTAASDLVRSVARGHALSAEAVANIVDRAEGVPLILEEVTRSAIESGSQ